METAFQNMDPATPPAARRLPWHAAATAENLMPYEAVAKAIFVKANGLPAYYRATGLAEHADRDAALVR